MRISRYIDFNKTKIMGILNVTPDSFSDGGEYLKPDYAVARALEMAEQGADIIDIGGESTRPGSERVSREDELRRVIPVIDGLVRRGFKAHISIDTYKSIIAQKAVEAGAGIINDISGGTFEPDIMKVASETGAYFVIMHIQGTPDKMQENPVYSDAGVVSDVIDFFKQQIEKAEKAGIVSDRIILDPGIGFGKTVEHNLELLRGITEIKKLGKKVLIGTSRKSFIGKLLDKEVDKRDFGTAATISYALEKGADIVRVHDVENMRDVALMMDNITGKTESKNA